MIVLVLHLRDISMTLKIGFMGQLSFLFRSVEVGLSFYE